MVAGAAIVTCLVMVALSAPMIAPHDVNAMDLINTLLPPSWMAGGDPAFPLGTDSLGRCILSQLIYGARLALTVAVVASIGAALIGVTIAVVSGYFGGRTDRILTQVVDLWMSFPPVVLALTLMVGLGTGVINVILAILLVDWTRFCRVGRAEVIRIRSQDYVSAARLLGFSHLRTIFREVLPALLPMVLTLTALEMGTAIVVEAILGFVGLSVPAGTASWGVLIADARSYLYQSPTAMIFPVMAIIVSVMGFNLLGDGLKDWFATPARTA
ncbi:ABC transporter permease [Mesorhizobium sp. M0659]|uniref:ABC transporter permease n=1 Tax=Mesorhizobium sp. M0659 TaxID=2956980 RepID=UPI003339AC48